MRKQKRLGLSLRGGAGRAAGYIGVFRALNESDISIDYMIGSSMGANIAVLYGMGLSEKEIIEIVSRFQLKNMLSLESIKELTLLGIHKAEVEIEPILKNIRLEDLKIPVFIQATNLNTRKSEIFEKGLLKQLIMATCAFPFYIPPIQINDSYYIDGDITSGYSVEYLKRKGADVVMGLSAGKMTSEENHNSLLSRFLDPIMIASENFRSKDLELHPLDIHIDNLGLDAGPFSYDKFPELINNAYNVTMAKMPEIKERLVIKSQVFYTINRTLNKFRSF